MKHFVFVFLLCSLGQLVYAQQTFLFPDTLRNKNTPLLTDSSDKIPNTKWVKSQLYGSGGSGGYSNGTPTCSVGSGAGSGASVTIDGTNLGGKITLITGTSLTASSTILTVTYSTSFPTTSYPITRAANTSTSQIETTDMATYLSGTASGFSVIGSSNVLAASTTYVWYYVVTGR